MRNKVKKMCKPVVLNQDIFGCVSYCHNCNNYRLAFGNLVCTLTSSQLSKLLKLLIADLRYYEFGNALIDQKIVMYNTSCNHIQMTLSYREMERLYDLIQNALLMHTAQSLISHNINKNEHE
jgi:hypothetical protein